MTNKITVYPTAKNSLVLSHPIDGPLSTDGSSWTRDGFTARMITDGAITDDPSKGWTPDVPVDAMAAPAHSTAVEDNPPTVKVTKR